MSGYKILLLCSAIAFLIGALIPVFISGGSPRGLNWLCLGLSFVTFAVLINTH